MLRRRSIRTKLIVALASLSAIVLLIAAINSWGMYGNQATANRIYERSDELRHASELESLALELGRANELLIKLLHSEAMIESINDDRSSLDVTRTEFGFLLDSFTLKMDSVAQVRETSRDPAIPDAAAERATLTSVRDSFATVARNHDRPNVLTYRSDVRESLNQLIADTGKLVAEISADLKQLLWVMTRDFYWVILLANLIAIPASVLIIQSWLPAFAYRIDVTSNWTIFLMVAGLSFATALLLIINQVINRARANPAEILANE